MNVSTLVCNYIMFLYNWIVCYFYFLGILSLILDFYSLIFYSKFLASAGWIQQVTFFYEITLLFIILKNTLANTFLFIMFMFRLQLLYFALVNLNNTFTFLQMWFILLKLDNTFNNFEICLFLYITFIIFVKNY